MDRLGDAYLYGRPDQLDVSREQQRGHIIDHMEMIVVCDLALRTSSFVSLLQRPRLSIVSVLFVDTKKNTARKKIYGKALPSLTHFTSAGPDPRTQLCCFSGTLSGPLLFLSLSHSTSYLLLSSVILPLGLTGFLFSLVFIVSLSHETCTPARSLLWAPLLPDRP